jgi:hypothetical protein
VTTDEWEALPAWVRRALTRRGYLADEVWEVEWAGTTIRVKLKPRIEVVKVEVVAEGG